MDKYIAPELSAFSSASIRDMTRFDAEQEHWLANYLLNSVFRGELGAPHRQQMYNFLRRSEAAFEEYAHAREATLGYLDDTEHLRLYLRAIGHWEAYLSHAWQAFLFVGQGVVRWFQKDDNSVLSRLNALHNRVKHADRAIARGNFIGDSPLCVWLTNDGLRSTDVALTFGEAAEVLEALALGASAVQDPVTMEEKLRAAMTSKEPES